MFTDEHFPGQLARGRRTAALSRAVSATAGLVVVAGTGGRATALIGFAILLVTAVVELALHAERRLVAEETFAALATVLIVSFGGQDVTVLELLWLCAVVSGVMARGGRIHWAGRAILAAGLIVPVLAAGRVELGYAAFCVAAIGLLLGTGRLTRNLAALLEQATRAADIDVPTGALSRFAFRRELDARVVAGGVSVLVVNLDGFGHVNRSQGHAAGDRTLTAVAGRLRDTLGPDHPIGRLGGDEFGVATLDDDPIALGELLLAGLAAPSHGVGGVGASIGIAWAPDHGRNADALLRAGDIAQRVAKRHGKGQVATFDGQSLTDEGPSGARGALQRLIAGEGVDMAVQPIFDIETGTVHAYEALARFRTRSTPFPVHWFTLAEEYGVRPELEIACLRAGLALLDTRPGGARLSVNLSAQLLDDPRVAEALDECGDVSGLIIEVTENSLVGDHIAAAGATARFTDRGVVFAVDDMGAGYAGLRQITMLRPAYLKVDRLLVRGIETSPERAALVEALVGYARRTESHLVAEGVETEAELAAVRALGVTLVQGYLLGRPVAPWPDLSRACVER